LGSTLVGATTRHFFLEETHGLDGFPEAHVVGQDAAQTHAAQKGQPVDRDLLVGPQGGAQIRGQLGLGQAFEAFGERRQAIQPGRGRLVEIVAQTAQGEQGVVGKTAVGRAGREQARQNPAVLVEPGLRQGRKSAADQRNQTQAIFPGANHCGGVDRMRPRAERALLCLGLAHHSEGEIKASLRNAIARRRQIAHAHVGFQAHPRTEQARPVASQIAVPAFDLVHEARGVRALEGRAPARHEIEIGAQFLHQAALGRLVAHRHRAGQVDHATVVDAHAGRVAVDQLGQNRQRRSQLAHVEHQARGQAAHDLGQALAAHLDRHAARELRQHAGRQLGQLARGVALDHGQVLQPGAAQFDLAVAGEGVAGQHQTGAGHRGDARIAMDGDHDLVAAIFDESAGQEFLLGHGHFAAVEKNQAGAHQRAHQGVQLGWRQGAVAADSRIRSACRSCCSTCRLRAWSGRESRADRVPCRGVSLPSARTTKRRSCSPPGTCEKRYTMRAQASSALGKGLASASPALAASPWPSAMAAAARCSHGRTRPGQSQSHSFSPGYNTTVGATARPGVRTRRTISSSLRDSTATAPARTRFTPLDQRPALQERRKDANSLVRGSGIQEMARRLRTLRGEGRAQREKGFGSAGR
jgi:hypothetical protein